MDFATVGDLKKYLEQKRLSPERLGKVVGISNMTLRRLLRKPPQTRIPRRYRTLLGLHGRPDAAFRFFSVGPDGFGPLLDQLEASGKQEIGVTEMELSEKFSKGNLESFRSRVEMLFNAAKSAKLARRYRALAIGALLYFLNPMDYLPDVAVGIGYLDDFAVLSLVSGLLEGLDVLG